MYTTPPQICPHYLASGEGFIMVGIVFGSSVYLQPTKKIQYLLCWQGTRHHDTLVRAIYAYCIHTLRKKQTEKKQLRKAVHSPPPCASVPAQNAAFLRTPALESTKLRLINGNAWLMYLADALVRTNWGTHTGLGGLGNLTAKTVEVGSQSHQRKNGCA